MRLDGEPLAKQRLAYVLLHKPAGVVTTARDPQGRPTVVDLVDHPARVVPVGRLDADTTGALLLTNDGDLAHRLAHPQLRGRQGLRRRALDAADRRRSSRGSRDGVELDDGPYDRARAVCGASRARAIELTIHEGRNRQVKRMFEAVGHRVRRLHRSRYATSRRTVSSRASGAS